MIPDRSMTQHSVIPVSFLLSLVLVGCVQNIPFPERQDIPGHPVPTISIHAIPCHKELDIRKHHLLQTLESLLKRRGYRVVQDGTVSDVSLLVDLCLYLLTDRPSGGRIAHFHVDLILRSQEGDLLWKAVVHGESPSHIDCVEFFLQSCLDRSAVELATEEIVRLMRGQ